MMGVSGQSIAAAADSCKKNGKSNTVWGTILPVTGTLVIFGGCLWFRSHFKRKDKDRSLAHSVRLENTKHNHRVEEAKLKNELKKVIIDYRCEQRATDISFNLDSGIDLKDESASVETYEEVVSGEETLSTALRLGVRCFHIGEDCGLIGRTNSGKTTFTMHWAISVARGFQEEGATISSEWNLEQSMKVLYFAFEQNKNHFKTKYGRYINDVPNLYIDVKTGAGDFETIRKKIMKMQSEIGNHRLLVVFDNITKMKSRQSNDKNAFFQWLEDYRVKCNAEGKPITYLKIFHTTGGYKDYMPIDATTNYGNKTDTYFTQDLVAFGMGKGGDGKLRYIKELKNKLEPDAEKRTLSVYRFADTQAPFYDYVREAEECDILPSRSDLIRRSTGRAEDNANSQPVKRGRKEDYSSELLEEMAEEKKTGFSWREIMDFHGIRYDINNKDGINNKTKGIKNAMKKHGIKYT